MGRVKMEGHLKLLRKRGICSWLTFTSWTDVFMVISEEQKCVLVYSSQPIRGQEETVPTIRMSIRGLQCCQGGEVGGWFSSCCSSADIQNQMLTLHNPGEEATLTLRAASQEERDAWVLAVESQVFQLLAAVEEVRPDPTAGRSPHWSQLIPRQYNPEADMLEFNYDKMYSTINPLTCNKDQDRGLVKGTLSQLFTTMDLNRVRLPTSVLECRSLLESYADGFGCPEYFVAITKGPDPWARLLLVLRFYLSTFKATRPLPAASKPYNPVQGEIFTCKWPLPSGQTTLLFLAEQTSHHPPITAIYAEHAAGITYTGHIFTRSGMRTKYFPPFLESMTVDHVGGGTIRLVDHKEEYTMSFPGASVRSIFSDPVLLVEGEVSVECVQTGLRAELNFTGTSAVSGNIYSGQEEVGELTGNWRGLVVLSRPGRSEEVVLDMRGWSQPGQPKQVAPVADQMDEESRRLWRGVTRALAGYSYPISGDRAKFVVETAGRQRTEVKAKYFKVLPEYRAEFKFPLGGSDTKLPTLQPDLASGLPDPHSNKQRPAP